MGMTASAIMILSRSLSSRSLSPTNRGLPQSGPCRWDCPSADGESGGESKVLEADR